jgi:UrcA family protein
MKKALISAAGVVAAVVGGNALAQTPENAEVLVESHRAVETTVGKSYTGIPIVDVSMNYTVTSKGLDIGTPAGAREFEARVKDAATAGCKELGQRYPNSSTSDTECVKKAVDKAMVDARKLEDAAAKKK